MITRQEINQSLARDRIVHQNDADGDGSVCVDRPTVRKTEGGRERENAREVQRRWQLTSVSVLIVWSIHSQKADTRVYMESVSA